eukprot:NODE_493_length_6829_cov_0.943248.p1 type:complete len:897 gc:universal NODE_493_length_6829_cov_0.943248:5405-2715(-)
MDAPRSRRNSSATLKTDDAISKMLKRQTYVESKDDESDDFKPKKPSRDTKSINEFGKSSTGKFFGKILDRKPKSTSDTASEMTADEVEEWNGNLEYNPAGVDVYVNNGPKPTCKCVFEVSNNHTIKMITAKQAITSILEQLEIKENNDPLLYDLYHFDLKYHGQRVEFQHMEFVDEVLRESYLNSVDEKWRIMKKDFVETLKISLANDDKEMILNYNATLSVKEAVEKVKAHFKLPEKDPFTLFCTSQHGYWLEENKPLRAYEFNLEDKVELRLNGYQLYVRVTIPVLDAKFVMKAPLTFTGADVSRLIQYNLKVRSLKLPKPSSHYSIFLTHNSTWMDLKRCLSDYGFNEKAGDFTQNINQCGIELRLQTEEITIFNDYGEPYRLLITEEATVQDVVNLCKLELTRADVPELWLYNKSGEKLLAQNTIWQVIKEVLSTEEFVLREQSRLIPFQLSVDDSAQEIEIYPSKKLEEIESLLERKFGIPKSNFKSFELRIDGKSYELDRKQNFHQIKIKPSQVIRINVNDKYHGIYMTMTDENVWLSGEDAPDNIRYSLTSQEITKDEIKQKDLNRLECNIAAGTLSKLIEKLTATEIKDFQLYNAYLQTFLLTYHSFTNSQTLFYKLKERYHVPRQQNQSAKDFIEFRNLVQLRVGNVLKVWTKQYQTAFEDPLKGAYLIKDVLEFSENILVPDKQAQLAKHIRKCLLRIGSMNNNQYQFSEPPPLPKLPKKFVQNPSIFHHDPEEIARQVCITESKFFQNILPTEFLGQAWAKSDGERRAPNVWSMTERFNSMASWTAKSVLEGKSLKRRANRIEFLVELASCLLNLRNFSGCMAVVAGLNSAAISRLKYSWNEVSVKSKKRKTELELALSPENAYRNYRSLLYANTDKDEAKIPYM